MEIRGLDHVYLTVSSFDRSFFEDPDGIRLGVVARSRHRDEIVERWGELRGFLNLVAERHRRDAGKATRKKETGA